MPMLNVPPVIVCAATPSRASIRFCADSPSGANAITTAATYDGRTVAILLLARRRRSGRRVEVERAALDLSRSYPAGCSDGCLLFGPEVGRKHECQGEQGQRSAGSDSQTATRPAHRQKSWDRGAKYGSAETQHKPQRKE